MKNIDENDLDICFDESGFSCGAGAPKITASNTKTADIDAALKADDGTRIVVARADVEPVGDHASLG